MEIGVTWAACGAALVDVRNLRLVDEPTDVAVATRAEGPSFHQKHCRDNPSTINTTTYLLGLFA